MNLFLNNNESNKEASLIEKNNKKADNSDYLNCGCCHVKIGILFGYLYFISSISIYLIIRVLFGKYLFKFNFTFLFCQQLFCLTFFFFAKHFSKTLIKETGELSFNDFMKMKWKYILFTILFMLNQLASFYGNQLVKNTAMFVILRKFILLFTFTYDKIVEKKKSDFYEFIAMLLILFGTVCVGKDDFSRDWIGYGVVLIYNTFSLVYIKYGEHFRKKTGTSNIKLLVYNSFIIHPFLIAGFFLSGEYKKLYSYLFEVEREPLFEIKLGIMILICSILVVFLNTSYLISNEKNSGFFTQLISASKDVLVSLSAYMLLKDFTLSFFSIGGLICSSLGAFIVSAKAIIKGVKKIDKKEKTAPKSEELIEIEKRDNDNNLENNKDKINN